MSLLSRSLLSGNHWPRILWDLFYFTSRGQGEHKQAQFTCMYLLFYDSSGCWGACILQVAGTDNRQGKRVWQWRRGVVEEEDHVLLSLGVTDQLLCRFVS